MASPRKNFRRVEDILAEICQSSDEDVPLHQKSSESELISECLCFYLCQRGSISARGRGKGKAPARKATLKHTAIASGTEEDQWHDISVKDNNPPKFPFKPFRTPGPQLIPTCTYNPVELLQLFFTSTVLQTILANTNTFGAMNVPDGQKSWKDFTMEDLYGFLALVIYMGIVKVPKLSDYWSRSNIYSLPLPSRIMSRKKFQKLLRFLHLSDPKTDADNDKKKGTPAYDRLHKIKPLYGQMVESCKANFHPFQSISIDERMVKSKARSSLKQYMKDKPTKWGYKLFVLADSSCGYTWNFFIYEGKAVVEHGKGLSYESVMALLEHKVLGTGYKLFVDNFYTSPTLFQDLLLRKTVACGTIRPNRIGFPKTEVNSMPRKAARGTIRWMRVKSLLFVRWMDTREVIMCSTMHRAYEGGKVRRRVKDKSNRWTVVSVPVPAAVQEYNKSMGGVDTSDALINYYNVVHKTRKWYKTFFYHFLDIAVVNSYILHCEMAKSRQQKALPQKSFREALVLQLLDCGSPSPVASTSAAPPSAPTHKPEYIKGDSTIGRRNCRQCGRKTPIICTTCQVPLCFVAQRDCFNMWHNEDDREDEENPAADRALDKDVPDEVNSM
uniref:PiggyBac transposable element-derived protein domain-containing protein n=1 Tax=Mastacembelus armatus TaxID=205130 RepID=A0A3Q3MT12_9TELE